ncbi:hypothetical protein LXL04_037353 [Taraxacum kok-saghyz]
MLFSATFPSEIQRLASDFLSNYIFLCVRRVGSSTDLILQKVVFVEDMEKCEVLRNLRHDQKANGNLGKNALVVIFVETKRAADTLESWLCRIGFPATAIHEIEGTKSDSGGELVLGGNSSKGLTSFPNYLVLHMRKFVMEAGWLPKKLGINIYLTTIVPVLSDFYHFDVYIDADDIIDISHMRSNADDIIDISHMRSKGLQPGQELLPKDALGGQEEPTKVLPNEDIVSQLAGMGFNYLHCQKAAINTSNVAVEKAMNWLLSHMDDPVLMVFCVLLSLILLKILSPSKGASVGDVVKKLGVFYDAFKMFVGPHFKVHF